MPGDAGVTVVTMLVCFISFAREAAGAARAAFPAPSDLRRGKDLKLRLAHVGGEIVKL
jgi:hypothetical protein